MNGWLYLAIALVSFLLGGIYKRFRLENNITKQYHRIARMNNLHLVLLQNVYHLMAKEQIEVNGEKYCFIDVINSYDKLGAESYNVILGIHKELIKESNRLLKSLTELSYEVPTPTKEKNENNHHIRMTENNEMYFDKLLEKLTDTVRQAIIEA